MPERELVVAIDLGGTRLRVALIDRQGTIHSRLSVPTRADLGREDVLRRLDEAVAEARRAAEHRTTAGFGPLLGIGVGAPGPIDPWTGVIYSPPNLPGWDNFPLKAELERRFGVPVMVGNDANLAALGEHRFGAGRGHANLVYLTVSTGIGGGIISNGQLLLGSQGLAGEIGHITIDIDGPICNCGNIGCLEALASGPSIARAAIARLRRGEVSRLPALVGGNPNRVTAETVVAAALEGDPVASDVLARAAAALGVGVLNVVHLLDPEIVIIGGGVSNAGELLFSPIRQILRTRAMPGFRERVQVVPAALGDDVGLLGAVALVLGAEKTGLRE